MPDPIERKDLFDRIQSDLYGVSFTQEQLYDVYAEGTSDDVPIDDELSGDPATDSTLAPDVQE